MVQPSEPTITFQEDNFNSNPKTERVESQPYLAWGIQYQLVKEIVVTDSIIMS